MVFIKIILYVNSYQFKNIYNNIVNSKIIINKGGNIDNNKCISVFTFGSVLLGVVKWEWTQLENF